MRLDKLKKELSRFYQQKEALISKKDSEKYSPKEYKTLLNFYNENIKQKREELAKENPNVLLQFAPNRTNEKATPTGTKCKSNKPSV